MKASSDNFGKEKRSLRGTTLYFCLILITSVFIFLYATPLSTSWTTTMVQLVRPRPVRTNVSSIRLEESTTSRSSYLTTRASQTHFRETRQTSKQHPLPSGTTSYIKKARLLATPTETTETSRYAELPSTSVPLHKGFLVYSENCRIPDLNPYHSSVKNMIEITEPLNCSTDYEPLTTTNGNVLFVHDAIARSKGFHNVTCCYQTLYRLENNKSDNGVKFSTTCLKVENEAIIPEEFILVRCSLPNGTDIYEDYHSFIHDKPAVEERCANSSSGHKYSVLMIGIDAMSRMNMHRQLKKTYSYLRKEMDVLEMYGFNKVGDNTFPNLVPLLLGHDERELPSVCWNTSDPIDKCDFIWNHFEKKGYRTFYAEDTPYISSFNYLKNGFYKQPTDYYFRNFMLAYEDALGRNKPLNCHLCVGSVSETEAVLHWTEKFAKHFATRPNFAFSWINSLTHDFLNMGSSGDHMYEKFFRELHTSGSLNKTFVFLMGDHGMRWGQIRSTYIGQLEERLPMLLVVVPSDFKLLYPVEAQNLMDNSHKLITPFDLHATLDHILHLDEEWKKVDTSGIDDELKEIFVNRSLSILQPIPSDRSCRDASIDEHWCTCEMSLAADTNSTEVKLLAFFLVNKINAILKTRASICAVLKLSAIQDSRLWHPPSENTSEYSIHTLIIKTVPGNAVFEGTLRSQNHDYELLGTISRLNLYRNQSYCVNDSIIKKYCFCL